MYVSLNSIKNKQKKELNLCYSQHVYSFFLLLPFKSGSLSLWYFTA